MQPACQPFVRAARNLMLVSIICLVSNIFVSPAAAQLTQSVEMTPADRANIALELLTKALETPNEYYIDQVCYATVPAQQEAVRASLQTWAAAKQRQAKQGTGVGLVAGSGQVLADKGGLDLELRSAVPDRTVRLALTSSRHTLLYSNLFQVLDTLQQLLAAAPPARDIAAQDAAEVCLPRWSWFSNQMFQQIRFSDNPAVYTFDVAASRGNFEGNELLSGPLGACAVACKSDVFLGPDRSWDVLLIADGNWNRLLYAGKDSLNGRFIKAAGDYGTGAMQFKRPVAIDANPAYVYVADQYNNRVVACDYAADGTITQRHSIAGPPYGEAADVAAAVIPSRNTAYRETNIFAVLSKGPADAVVRVFRQGKDSSAVLVGEYSRLMWASGALLNPTALCFGRHAIDNMQTYQLYVVDNGNHRVVGRSADPSSTHNFKMETPPGTFPDDAYLTSIDTDAYGYLYVLDSRNCRVYLLPPDLSKAIAYWGVKGRGENLLWYPQSLSHMYGWQKFTDTNGVVHHAPMSFGIFVFTEPFGDATGPKKFKLGVNADMFCATYQPIVGTTYNTDFIELKWEQSTPGYVRIERNDNEVITGRLYTAGEHRYSLALGPLDGFGQFTDNFALKVQGVYSEDNYQSWAVQTTQLSYYRSGPPPGDPPLTSYPRVGNASVWASDLTTGLLVDYVYGYPSKWWRIDLGYRDLCPDPTRPLCYEWRSVNADNSLSDSVDFCLNPFQPGAVVTNRLETNEPWVYARFKYRANPTVEPVVTRLGQVAVYQMVNGLRQTIEPCYVSNAPAAKTTTAPYWATFDVTLPYMCAAFGSTCPPVVHPPGSGGCPFLYVLGGSDPVLINNLLPQSELSTDTVVMKRDFVPLLDVAVPDSGLLNLRIREDEQELSQFDRAELVSLIVPRSLEWPRISHRSDLVSLTGQYIEPSLAMTNTGQDVTALLRDADEDYFSASDSGWLEVEYTLAQQAPRASPSVALTLDGGGVEVPPPGKTIYKLSTQQTVANRVTLQVYTATGALVDVAVVPPRVRLRRQFVDLSDYVSEGTLKIRLTWQGPFYLDALPFRFCTRPAVTIERTALSSAVHSVRGSVRPRLLRTDGTTVTLQPGQYLDLAFPLTALPDSLKRLPIFIIDGRYARMGIGRPDAGNVPAAFAFEQNYPNPFNPSTTFRFSLPSKQLVRLEIFNVLGQKVATVIDREVEAGQQVYQWNGQVDGQPIASGVYLAKLTAGSQSATRKMVVVK